MTGIHHLCFFSPVMVLSWASEISGTLAFPRYISFSTSKSSNTYNSRASDLRKASKTEFMAKGKTM